MNALPFASQRYVPWRERATYTSALAAGDAVIAIGDAAVYPGPVEEAAPSGGAVTRADAHVRLGFDSLGGVVPKPGDSILWTLRAPNAAARTLIVLRVQPAPYLRFWAIDGRSLDVSTDLGATATILRPDPSPTPAGHRAANFAELVSAVACRLQADGWKAENQTAGKLVTRREYKLYLAASAPPLAAGDVAVVGGVRYEVRGQSPAGPLANPVYADVTRIE